VSRKVVCSLDHLAHLLLATICSFVKVVDSSSTPNNLISHNMKFLSLPKIGQHIAEKKEVTIEDPAFVNAKKVFMILVKYLFLICSDVSPI